MRLLGTPVQPVFVFDGPKKPVLKRNKRSGRGDSIATAQAKRLIRLYGFAMHDAPGEAEAECALLQRHGIVDAVLSEDVDTIMFGCTKTLRNWSAEAKSSKAPTHVSLYDVHDPDLAGLGLDREGMVLVALMSGGDYLPDGIPGCGVKVACEAAKAGYGTSICRLRASDQEGMRAWRQSITHELRTNEKGHFRNKHKALVVPDDFPSLEVLRYYTHPVVSPQSTLGSVRQKLEQRQDMHLDALREFTRETFGWDFRIGAVKFIRVLGQAMLVHRLSQEQGDGHGYVRRIAGRRQHVSTDGKSELRVAYVPSEVVPIDLSEEVDEVIPSSREGLALNNDEFEDAAAGDDGDAHDAAAAGKAFDVSKPELAWVLEGLARKSVPGAVEEWEEAQLAKASRKPPTKKKAGSTRRNQTPDEDQTTMGQFFRVAKAPASAGSKAPSGADQPLGPPRHRSKPLGLPRLPSPRQESKQPRSRASQSQATPSDPLVIGSSPVTPRRGKPAHGPETILISSSPVGPPTLSAPSARRRHGPRPGSPLPGSPLPDAVEGLGPGLAARSTSQGLSRGRRRSAQDAARASQTGALTQTSMDSFVSRSVGDGPSSSPPAGPDRGKAPDAERDGHGSRPARRAPESPGKRRHKGPGQGSEHSPARLPTATKKLLVPCGEAPGYFREVEADGGRLRDGGTRAGAVRRSDISVIDLTGGN